MTPDPDPSSTDGGGTTATAGAGVAAPGDGAVGGGTSDDTAPLPNDVTLPADGPGAAARPRRVTLAAWVPAPAPGLELGSVRLLEEVGRGGMGTVFRGRDRVLGRDVAVKFLNPSAGLDPDAVPRFLEEVRAAAAVRHPHLVPVYHADLAGEAPYLVMEYVAGPTLRRLVDRTGPLPLPLARCVLEDVATAVAALHDAGRLHRDLKPANVLVDPDGRARVTDFGLVARFAAPAGAAALAPAGGADVGRAGTPLYMAPELFDGRASPRTDIYAIGVTAFELLCGRRPFDGPTVDDVRAAHASRPLPAAWLADRGVPAAVVEVVERATHKQAMFRYKSANDLLRALRAAFDGAAPRVAGEAAPAEQAKVRAQLCRLVIRCELNAGGVGRADPAATPGDTPTSGAQKAAGASPAPTPVSPSSTPTATPQLYTETIARFAAARREAKGTAPRTPPPVALPPPPEVPAPRRPPTWPAPDAPAGGAAVFPTAHPVRPSTGVRAAPPAGTGAPDAGRPNVEGDGQPTAAGRVAPTDLHDGDAPGAGASDGRAAVLPGTNATSAGLAADLPCVRCGYNLRTLHPDAACPECATAVRTSLDPGRLLLADPRWLRRLRLGLLLVLAAPVASIVLAVLVFGIPATRAAVVETDAEGVVAGLLIGLPVYAGLLSGIVGTLLTTSRRPGFPLPRATVTCRALALAVLGTEVVTIALPLAGGAWGERVTDHPATAAVQMALVVAGAVAFLWHLGAIGRGWPEPAALRHVRRAAAVAVPSTAALAAAATWLVLSYDANRHPVLIVLFGTAVLAGVGAYLLVLAVAFAYRWGFGAALQRRLMLPDGWRAEDA